MSKTVSHRYFFFSMRTHHVIKTGLGILVWARHIPVTKSFIFFLRARSHLATLVHIDLYSYGLLTENLQALLVLFSLPVLWELVYCWFWGWWLAGTIHSHNQLHMCPIKYLICSTLPPCDMGWSEAPGSLTDATGRQFCTWLKQASWHGAGTQNLSL